MASLTLHLPVALLLMYLISSAASAKIVMLPFPWKSHVGEFTAIGEALMKRGHEVSFVLPPTYPDTKKMKMDIIFDIIEYKITEDDFYSGNQEESMKRMANLLHMSPVNDMREYIHEDIQFCINPLSDEDLFRRLRLKNFDLAIVDGMPTTRCYFVIPYRLGIPYVSLTAVYEPWLYRIPAIPSFVPFQLGRFFTDEMSFTERLQNLYEVADWSYDAKLTYVSDDFIKKYTPDKPFQSLEDLARGAKLILYDSDFILDYARPMWPHEVNIGGLAAKPAKPLPVDLAKFVEGSEGFIIVSFGSFDTSMLLGDETQEMFLLAFSNIQHKVVLRSSTTDFKIKIPSNVKVMKWIPQNDLLGHPNCRLFVTHCGANSQFEALYHAVPMLGIPIFGDQPYNARRLVRKGFGLHMDALNLTSESLASNIKYITSNETYYENIDRASIVFHSREQSPRDRAATWIERVLSPGGVDYLMPKRALFMPWYEYLMVDIFLLVFCLPLTVFMALACGVFCYFCQRRQDRQTKSKSE